MTQTVAKSNPPRPRPEQRERGGNPVAPLLEVDGLKRSFGGLVAVDHVSFRVLPGEIKAIIGPNGAGKTTLFNIVSGIIKPNTGTVRYRGSTITGMRPYQIGRRGISRTFQNLSLFPHMTVLENVMVGCHCRVPVGMLASALRLPRHYRAEKRIRAAAHAQLETVGLADRSDVPVASLSFGQRRSVELARALATQPTLLLLDEPASGMNTRETADLGQLITTIRDRGIAILLVEHDMSLVMDIADSILVLDFGKPVAEGAPGAIRNDSQVIAIYLGGDFDSAAH